MFSLIVILFPFYLNKLLNIENIYLKQYGSNHNNFSIMITTYENYKIFNNNIFKIILKSENINEYEKNITFECSIFLKEKNYIKCSLKELIPNHKGPFYLKKEHFQKSFQIFNNEEYDNYTLELNENIFFTGIIKKENQKRNINDYILIFNYKSSDFKIPIAMALDNHYIYLTIIAINSIMLNSDSDTFYNFYIMHSPNLSENNKNKILNLTKIYKKCTIEFFDMKDQFKKAPTIGRRLTTPTYYRISLPDLLPTIDKIIYLDSDIICYHDLKEMYYINMENYYFKGFLYYSNDSLCKDNDIYICAGVLLINLKELRKDDMVKKLNHFLENNDKKIFIYLDQSLINYVCKDKIGILDPKFGRINFVDLIYQNESIYNNRKFKYTREELIESYSNPVIYHFIRKPWVDYDRFQNFLFWDFTKKIGYYNEVCEFYKVCDKLNNKSSSFDNKKKKKGKRNFIKKIYNLIKLFFKKLMFKKKKN